MFQWYVQIDGREQGPLAAKQIKQMVRAGDLLPSDLVRKADQGQWHQARKIRGLFEASRPVPVGLDSETEDDPLAALVSASTGVGAAAAIEVAPRSHPSSRSSRRSKGTARRSTVSEASESRTTSRSPRRGKAKSLAWLAVTLLQFFMLATLGMGIGLSVMFFTAEIHEGGSRQAVNLFGVIFLVVFVLLAACFEVVAVGILKKKMWGLSLGRGLFVVTCTSIVGIPLGALGLWALSTSGTVEPFLEAKEKSEQRRSRRRPRR